MRNAVAFYGLLAAMIVAAAPAKASECPGNPDALGTSRTIAVDPAGHHLVGGHQYRESLPLNHKDVVITFDDGPLPPYTTRVLDVLARECVKATFFMVGRMARAYPKLVQRVDEEGHTLANHSQNHPFNFHTMSVADAAREIESGFESIAAAAGDPAKVAPFFRFPGLLRQEAIERYLASRQMMSWSVDLMADDWRHISARDIVARAIERLEAKGKGILLLHDIQPATALALPQLLAELKARGYRVVHVVPASAKRPATATTADQWVLRQPRPQTAEPQTNVWPRVLAQQVRATAPSFAAPSVMSFGADSADGDVPVMLVSAPETRSGEGDGAATIAWPDEVITIAALPEVERLPAPAAHHFRYHRMTRSRARKDKPTPPPETTRPNPEIITRSVNTDVTGSVPANAKVEPKAGKVATAGNKSSKTGKAGKARKGERPASTDPIGHQIQISRPQANLAR